eukprot:g1223.t1
MDTQELNIERPATTFLQRWTRWVELDSESRWKEAQRKQERLHAKKKEMTKLREQQQKETAEEVERLSQLRHSKTQFPGRPRRGEKPVALLDRCLAAVLDESGTDAPAKSQGANSVTIFIGGVRRFVKFSDPKHAAARILMKVEGTALRSGHMLDIAASVNLVQSPRSVCKQLTGTESDSSHLLDFCTRTPFALTQLQNVNALNSATNLLADEAGALRRIFTISNSSAGAKEESDYMQSLTRARKKLLGWVFASFAMKIVGASISQHDWAQGRPFQAMAATSGKIAGPVLVTLFAMDLQAGAVTWAQVEPLTEGRESEPIPALRPIGVALAVVLAFFWGPLSEAPEMLAAPYVYPRDRYHGKTTVRATVRGLTLCSLFGAMLFSQPPQAIMIGVACLFGAASLMQFFGEKKIRAASFTKEEAECADDAKQVLPVGGARKTLTRIKDMLTQKSSPAHPWQAQDVEHFATTGLPSSRVEGTLLSELATRSPRLPARGTGMLLDAARGALRRKSCTTDQAHKQAGGPPWCVISFHNAQIDWAKSVRPQGVDWDKGEALQWSAAATVLAVGPPASFTFANLLRMVQHPRAGFLASCVDSWQGNA